MQQAIIWTNANQIYWRCSTRERWVLIYGKIDAHSSAQLINLQVGLYLYILDLSREVKLRCLRYVDILLMPFMCDLTSTIWQVKTYMWKKCTGGKAVMICLNNKIGIYTIKCGKLFRWSIMLYAFQPPFSCAVYHSSSNHIYLMVCILCILSILLIKYSLWWKKFSTSWWDMNSMPHFLIIFSDVIIK